jgi:hypothetical protein
MTSIRREVRGALVALLASALAFALIATFTGSSKHGTNSSADAAGTVAGSAGAGDAAASTTVAAGQGAAAGATATTVAAGNGAPAEGQDLDGGEDTTSSGCTLKQASLRQGQTGTGVQCLQKALAAEGLYSGTISGTFDTATYNAVEQLQTKQDLFVDGVVGRETAIALGIWPDEASLVVHTPKPAPGAKDSLGYPLSSVASTGANAPPLPENSGSGRRVVYSRAGQRVWAVDKNNRIIRSYLVSGSKYNNEQPGVHKVFSRSPVSTAWNGKAFLPKMVRYQKTDIGNIGFHAIPIHRADGTAYMTEAELGTRLSGGCQRQANADAAFMWAFAQIGTTVVVV